MKILYTLLVMLITSNLSFSQILTTSHPVTNYSGPDDQKLTAHFVLTNSGNQNLNVHCEMINRTMTPGHYSYFCWTLCYDTSIYLSLTPIALAPGQSTSNFEGWAGADNQPGHDEITYRFYDMNGMSDTLYLTFKYDFSDVTGVNEVSLSKNKLNFIGQNPANNSTIVTYNVTTQKDAKIIVSNLLGSKVNEISINPKATSMTIPLADYKSGVYVLTLIVDGKTMSSKKLVVAHQ
jgi:hypothetical protein